MHDASPPTPRRAERVARVVARRNSSRTPPSTRPRTKLRRVSDVDGTPQGAGLPADAVILAKLRTGDDEVFAAVLDAWSPGMMRVARGYVADDHAAEDVVQESWLGVLRGIGGFEARSSLRTWAYRIVINTAKTRGVRDARTIPISSLAPTEEDSGPTVDPGRFSGPNDRYPGYGRGFPAVWPSPEGEAVAHETRDHLAQALALLPARQRMVITLRDVQGYTADEVCELLGVTPVNQRVLLHRARAAVRASLEQYLTTTGDIGATAP
jgi:RNA polymerase sigma-70 factor, ECF subfamily